MGIVFKTEMDLNVHSASNHSHHGSRNIPVDFQFNRNTSRFNDGVRGGSGVTVVQAAPLQPRPQGIIIPSAQFSGGRDIRIVPERQLPNQEFPTLGPSLSAQSTADWRAVVQSHRQAQTQPQSARTQLDSTSMFPSLGPPSSSQTGSSSSGWGKKNISALLQQPAKSKKTFNQPQPQRRHVLPLPDIWPENMRHKLEAREQGLPEPPDEDPPLPDPTQYLELKKKKEPKKKTVKAAAVEQKLVPKLVASSSSKFQAFADVADENPEEVSSEAWLSSTAIKAKQKKDAIKKKEKEKVMEDKKKKQEEEAKVSRL